MTYGIDDEDFFGEILPDVFDQGNTPERIHNSVRLDDKLQREIEQFRRLKQDHPDSIIVVSLDSISEEQIGYIDEFLKMESNYLKANDSSHQGFHQKVVSFQHYRRRLSNIYGERLTLWLLENGFKIVHKKYR